MTPEEFEVIWTEVHPYVFRVVFGALKQQKALTDAKTAAEDAIQDTAVYIMERLHKYTRLNRSYITSVALDKARHRVRRLRNGLRKGCEATPVGSASDLARIEAVRFRKQGASEE